MTKIYRVGDLQACEPTLLPDYPVEGWPTVGLSWTTAGGITVVVTKEDDMSGAHAATVEVYGFSPKAVLDFVLEEWGSDDATWNATTAARMEKLRLADLVGERRADASAS